MIPFLFIIPFLNTGRLPSGLLAAFSSTRLKKPSSLSLFLGEVLQPSVHLCGPHLDTFQKLHILLVLGSPDVDAVLHIISKLAKGALSPTIQITDKDVEKSTSPKIDSTLHWPLLGHRAVDHSPLAVTLI